MCLVNKMRLMLFVLCLCDLSVLTITVVRSFFLIINHDKGKL